MTLTTWVLLSAGLLLAAYSVVVTAILVGRRGSSSSQQCADRLVCRSAQLSAEEKARHYQQQADEAMRLSHTFQKFVPRQFVDHLAKQGSQHLELGHADEDEVAILFCDIRGFTGLSEQMTPQELMNFLNSYFLRMNGPIHQNRGFIDKFIGDAIMALFDHPGGMPQDKARDALHAAIDLRKALAIYNQHRNNSGYSAINVGVGIHFGPVILGTVGSDDRMDTTVIGDSVNIAYRLESLAPRYNADIVVSAQLLSTVQSSTGFTTRLLDWVRVKGRQAPIEIYEVLDHLPPSEREQRLASSEHIAAGVRCRKLQQWDSAIEHFNAAQAAFPNDVVTAHHLAMCEIYRHLDLPTDWDGALSADLTAGMSHHG
ncbi:adenylate/guanylate cyclase domain-containing protein [Alteromonas sp. ASW11-19]|uniref:Adenylate/guanylate cyclase domain-containing protein n=1 Tax=Alteromonas salexigens TaxID=2982530 RepID=A0ABT2VJD9_9ALTE|nr:adenylate/guanylate cyclase domain-containing protein [Alteromonas salexigens]MCU7553340.1 adenylate/guanylate cyclase domain-containing protein [Alteromonas salexigens]